MWNISDDWSGLLTYVTEQTESRGEWETDPSLGGHRIIRFIEDFREDDWYAAAFTLKGDLGFANLSVTATKFDRDFAYEWDNNAYTQSKDRAYGGAYLRFTENCYATNPNYGDYACYNAAGNYVDSYGYTIYSYAARYYTNYAFSTLVNDQKQERDQVEIRLQSQDDAKLRWMIGGYYEEVFDTWFYYTEMPDHLNTTAWAAANAYAYYYKYTSGYDNLQYPLPDTTYHYVQTMERTNTQIAFFGEVDYDVTDDLTVSVGVRWAENERDELDRYEWPQGLPTIGGYGTDGFYGDKGKSDDTFFKFGVQYKADDDRMFYGLFSQGFRLGGTNSIRAASSGLVPRQYEPDFMDNYEIGMKSEWLDNSLQLNVSAFHMKWRDYQISLFNLCQWWIRGTDNAGGAESTGIEVNGTWKATDRLKIKGSLFSADAKFTDDFFTPDDPTSLEIRDGQDMPGSPGFKAWLSFSYDVPDVLGGDMWMYYDFSYQDETWNTTDNARDKELNGLSPSWTHSNFSMGLDLPNNFHVTLKVNNLFDESTETSINDTIQGYSEEFPGNTRDRLNGNDGRPRTVWLSLRKGF